MKNIINIYKTHQNRKTNEQKNDTMTDVHHTISATFVRHRTLQVPVVLILQILLGRVHVTGQCLVWIPSGQQLQQGWCSSLCFNIVYSVGQNLGRFYVTPVYDDRNAFIYQITQFFICSKTWVFYMSPCLNILCTCLVKPQYTLH